MELDTASSGNPLGDPGPDGTAMIRGVVHDAEGQPIPGAHLSVVAPDGRQVANAPGDANGVLRVDLAPGRYLIALSAPGHAPKAGVLDLAAVGAEVDVTLHREAELRGVVRTGSDVTESALVTLLDENGGLVRSARTDASGAYCIAAPDPGTYTLLAVAPGAAPISKTLRWPSDPPVHDLGLTARARVHGVVRSPSGSPLAGAQVRLLDATGAEVDTRTTPADGTFEFPGLPEGRYTVWANGFPATSQLLRLAEEESGRAEVIADIMLTPEGGVAAEPVSIAKDSI